MIKEKLVPELRFSEFEGTWTENNLGDIAEVINGGTPSTTKKEYWNGEIAWATPTDVTASSKYIRKTSRYITELGLEKSSANLLPVNSILMTSRATIGELVINEVPMATNQGFKSFIPNNVNLNFLYYLLSVKKNNFKKIATGSTFLEVSITDTRNISFYIPLKSEQEKIGSFFYKIDKKIELQENLIENLEKQKKGLMQRIFNQELRFKDENGNEYPEWERNKMSNYIKLQGGTAFKSNKYKEDGIPIIRISNIGSKVNLDKDIVYYPEFDIDKKFVLQSGDLLIAMSGATTGKTGIYMNKKIAYLNQRVGKFESVNNKLYYDYLYQLVNSSIFRNKLNTRLVAGAQPNISSRDIEGLVFKFPSYNEQNKIANLLSLWDNKINLEKEKLESYLDYKKGLMQRMFI